MRLPSYTYDKDDLARHLSVAAEGPEEVIEADEYLQPNPSTPQSADSSKVPLMSSGASNKDMPRLIRDKRYTHLESAAARQQNELSPKNRYRGDSINGRYSSDPVKYIKERQDEPDGVQLKISPPRTSPRQEPRIQPPLPLDEDDYLQPKSANPQAYLELENNKDYYLNEKQMPPAPPTPLEQYNDIGNVPSIFENPEYFDRDDSVMNKKIRDNNLANKKVKPKVAPKPKKLSDYYNDPDKLEREKRPLLVSDPNPTICSNGESTI